MRKWLGVGLLGCVWLIACGGKLIDGGTHGNAGAFDAGAPSAGTPGAGAPGAGASSVGAGTGSGTSGQAGGTSACVGDGFIACAAWCGSPASDYVQGECIDGSWRCPGSSRAPDTCPLEACVRQGVRCCDHEFGNTSVPDCGSDGLFGPCPVGFERNADVCVSDSAHTTNCGTLYEQSCTLEAASCEAQGAHCWCRPADGGLAWDCVWDIL
jgi:hypothetical protein